MGSIGEETRRGILVLLTWVFGWGVGAFLVALPNKYRIQTIVNDYPGLVLEPLLAGGQG